MFRPDHQIWLKHAQNDLQSFNDSMIFFNNLSTTIINISRYNPLTPAVAKWVQL